MAEMPISVLDVIQIARDVTGRTDASDPQFTDAIMTQRLNVFLQAEHPQEIRLFQNRGWYDFTISDLSPDPFPIDLSDINRSTIEPPMYIDGFVVYWYQDPAAFFAIWPATQPYQPQRPTYVLYYNNELTFRGPPDQSYDVRVASYRVPDTLLVSDTLASPYLARYLAYGMSLDIFADFSEMDQYQNVMAQYRRYRGQVLARTWQQYNSQRAYPTF